MATATSDPTLGGHYETILLRLSGEISLKSERVRRRLIDHVANNIRNKIRRHDIAAKLSVTRARFYLAGFDRGDAGEIVEILAWVPGIVSFSFCHEFMIPAADESTSSSEAGAGLQVQEIEARLLSLAEKVLGPGNTFAVRAKRVGKHAFSSQGLERKLGAAVLHQFPGLGLKVDLDAPDITLHVELRDLRCAVFHEVTRVMGGLPADSPSFVACVLEVPVTGSWEHAQWLINRGIHLLPLLFMPSLAPGMDLAMAGDKHVAALEESLFRLLDKQERNVIWLGIIPGAGLSTLIDAMPDDDRAIAKAAIEAWLAFHASASHELAAVTGPVKGVGLSSSATPRKPGPLSVGMAGEILHRVLSTMPPVEHPPALLLPMLTPPLLHGEAIPRTMLVLDETDSGPCHGERDARVTQIIKKLGPELHRATAAMFMAKYDLGTRAFTASHGNNNNKPR